MSDKFNRLPPIVQQYIGKLTEKGIPSFQRDTACLMLENIIDQATSAVNEYKSKAFRRNENRNSR